MQSKFRHHIIRHDKAKLLRPLGDEEGLMSFRRFHIYTHHQHDRQTQTNTDTHGLMQLL